MTATTPAPLRRSVLVATVLLPAVFTAMFVRPVPADAAASPYGFYVLDLAGFALGVEGEIGAGGGLTPVDPSLSSVITRLDSSPSATATASAVEPGTLPRTVLAVANSSAGQEIASIPLAQANHPGEPEGTADLVGQTDLGGVIASGLTARARADRLAVGGEATVGQLRLPDDPATAARLWTGLDGLRLRFPGTFGDAGARTASMGIVDEATTTVSGTVDEASGHIVATATSSAERIRLLGEIDLRGVVGTTRLDITPDASTSEATLDIASLTIAGVPVEASDDGVVVDGTGVPGEDVEALTIALNDVLAEAGISINLISPVEEDVDGRAVADSRGLRIAISTPALADGGVPANDAALVIGGVRTVVQRQPPVAGPDIPLPTSTPEPAPSVEPTTAAPAPTGPRTGVEVVGVGTPPSTPTTTPPVAAPEVAPPSVPPAPTPVAAVAVVGVELDPRVAIALLGLWQALSLGGVTSVLVHAKRNGRLT